MSMDMAEYQEDSPKLPQDTFAARLVLIRHEMRLTVDEISVRCEVPSATWSTWERGTKPRDLADVCRKIAVGTGYDPNWLIWGGLPLRAECASFEVIDGGADDMMQPPLPFRSRLTSVS